MEADPATFPSFAALSPPERLTLYGEAFHLLSLSELHRAYSIADFEARVIEPIARNQFRIYRKQRGPVALLTWAFVSDEIHDRLHEEPYDLASQDWMSGPHLWYVDFVAPYGDGSFVINDMLANVFPDKVGHAQRVLPGSKKPFHLRSYYGVDVAWRKEADRKAAVPHE